jgi:hypothetical protein
VVFFIWRAEEESAAIPLAEAEIASDDMVERCEVN